MGNSFLMALGQMLILEGLLPLLLPQAWRDTFKRMIELKNGQLRFVGLMSVIGGLLLFLLSK